MKKFLKKVITYFCTKIVKKNAKSYGDGLRVNGLSTVTDLTKLGKNVNFNGMKITGRGNVEIGDNFHSGSGCLIMTSFHNYDNGKCIPYDNTNINKDVIISDNVWLGSRVIVLGGVKIGEGAVIQAGSVVVSDIPKYSIAGGHPAVVFKQRDIEHYERLKVAGKFF